jgi:hypothetical protein|tara:strand:+ start:700 stop:1053 length:354 start_codon:yes stop_codon:yes gene_type:complete
MNPKVCPVCVGRGSVPSDLYAGVLPTDWKPGDGPQIQAGCGECECQTCEGLGVVWPPNGVGVSFTGDEDGSFTYFGESSQVLVTASSVSLSNMYEWDETTTPAKAVALTLVGDTDED